MSNTIAERTLVCGVMGRHCMFVAVSHRASTITEAGAFSWPMMSRSLPIYRNMFRWTPMFLCCLFHPTLFRESRRADWDIRTNERSVH